LSEAHEETRNSVLPTGVVKMLRCMAETMALKTSGSQKNAPKRPAWVAHMLAYRSIVVCNGARGASWRNPA